MSGRKFAGNLGFVENSNITRGSAEADVGKSHINSQENTRGGVVLY